MTKAETERRAIVTFLRAGGEYCRGRWYSWDSEMRGYASSFADRIEAKAHITPTPEINAEIAALQGVG